MEQQITLEQQEENVWVLTLTGKPHKANVFGRAMIDRMDELLTKVEENAKNSCALVITGAGSKFFSAGFDLQALTGGGTHATADGQELVWRTWKMLARLLVLDVPTIAVFNGHAFGLGFFLGLACDHRVMIDHNNTSYEKPTQLCLPEISLGLPLGEGLAALAKCKLPHRALKDSALTGKRWTCHEALGAGIIDAVVPPPLPGGVPEQVTKLARHLASTSEKGNLHKIKLELFGEAHAILNSPHRSKL